MNRNITQRERVIGASVLLGLLMGIGCGSDANKGADIANGDDAGQSAFVDGGAEPDANPGCMATAGADLPDDDFADTNCDGIDGDRAHAIFVAVAGADNAVGTLEAPVQTIAKAVSLAIATKKDVYVCNGTYAENVVVATTGVGIYGGYDCANAWARGNDRATIAPPSGIPLAIRDLGAMIVDRVTLQAADAISLSESSIGAFVSNVADLQLAHVAITSGRGSDGVSPPAPPSIAQSATDGNPGHALAAATCSRNDANRPAACNSHGAGGFAIVAPPACEGTGGAGGDGGNILMGVASTRGTSGGLAPRGGATPGANGSDGSSGAAGVAASSGLGSIMATGYVASNAGTDGADGVSAGGGAGGYGGNSAYVDSLSPNYAAGGGGGQGGYGGCGGTAAKGGGAGGASIGLLLFNSNVKIRNASLRTSAGGSGGRSVAGAQGQFGGLGGIGGTGTQGGRYTTDGNGLAGGNGGRGGAGGAGGAGGGGPSFGIFSNDRAPTLTAVTFNTDSGGKGGSGAGSVDGADGIASDVYVVSALDGGAADAATHD